MPYHAICQLKIVDKIGEIMLTPEEEKYLKTISKTKIVRIFSYDAKIKEIVKDITNKINQAMPELEVKFLGASALEISGQKISVPFCGCFFTCLNNLSY